MASSHTLTSRKRRLNLRSVLPTAAVILLGAVETAGFAPSWHNGAGSVWVGSSSALPSSSSTSVDTALPVYEASKHRPLPSSSSTSVDTAVPVHEASKHRQKFVTTWSKVSDPVTSDRHGRGILPRPLQQTASDSVEWSLKRMGEARLLTAAQEIELGSRCQRLAAQEEARGSFVKVQGRDPNVLEWAKACNFTAGFLARSEAHANADGAQVVSEADVARAFRRELAANRLAKEQLVNANMRLVVSIARRYQNLGVSLQDLVQEGCFGLIRAAEKYDPSRGFRFSTYASWWVQQSVFRAVAFQSRMIRLPMHVHNLLNKVRATRKKMFQEEGISPSDEDVAARLGLPLAKLQMMLRAATPTSSTSASQMLRSKKGSGSGSLFQGSSMEDSVHIEDSDAENLDVSNSQPEKFVETDLFRSEMSQLLDCLDEDERFVVCLRYGLGVPQRLSMGQIAELAGVGKVWVKKMEQRALRKLRRPHIYMKLRPFSAERKTLDEAMHDQDRMRHYQPTWHDGTEMASEQGRLLDLRQSLKAGDTVKAPDDALL